MKPSRFETTHTLHGDCEECKVSVRSAEAWGNRLAVGGSMTVRNAAGSHSATVRKVC